MIDFFLPALGWFIIATTVRFSLLFAQSRYQMLGVCLIAGVLEWAFGNPPSALRWAVCCGAIVSGVVLAKWSIEGVNFD